MKALRETTAFAVTLVLAAELLLPLAHASASPASTAVREKPSDTPETPLAAAAISFSPEAKNIAGCIVSEMSDADRTKWWNYALRFQAQELSAMTPEQLKRNIVGEKPKRVPPEVKVFDLRQVAQLLGMKPEDVAEELDKSVDDVVTEGEIKYLESLKKKPGLLAELQRLFKGKPKAEVEVLPYESYKFTMPNGQTIAVKDFLEMIPIDKEHCSLGSSNIQGKVSYAALLDRNLRLGFDQSRSTVEYRGSHLASTKTTAYFGEMSETIVVPDLYRRYVLEVGKWNYIDLVGSLLAGVGAYVGAESVEKAIKSQAEKLESIKGVLPVRGEAASFAAAHPDIAGQLGRMKSVGDELKYSLDDIIRSTDKAGEVGARIGIMDPADVQTLAGIGKSLSEDTLGEVKTITQTIAKLKAEERILRTAADILASRATMAFYYGMAWMGPARFALEASSGFFFQTRAPAAKKDQYLDVYANTKVLSDFKRTTGFMGLGEVMSFLGNVMKVGPPDKAFSIKNVAMVNQVGEEAQPEGSTTSIQWGGDQWIVKTDWRGESEAAMVEDTRAQKEFSSLGVFAKDVDISARLHQRALQTGYYKLLALAAPLLTWRFLTKGAVIVGPLRVLTQLATFDFVVNNFVNPHEWIEGELCSETKMNTFLNWYKAWIGAGWAETVITAVALGPVTKALEKAAVVPAWKMLLKGLGYAPMVIDPAEIAKMVIVNKGFEYLAACKDTSYTILAYQKLEKEKRGVTLNQTIQKSGLAGQFEKLNLGQLLDGIGSKIEEAQLRDALNFKGFFENQRGQVNAPELLYLHAEAAAISWRDVYARLEKEGCLREAFVGRDGTAWVRDGTGWRLVNTTTNAEIASFAGDEWRDRALFSQTHVVISRALTPNKVITTPSTRDCGSLAALQISGEGIIAIAACPSLACVAGAVGEVTGVTTEVGAALGRVLTVSTDEAAGSIKNGVARFYRSIKKDGEEAGTEYRLHDAVVQVTGDFAVKVSGKTMDGESKEIEVGRLTAIIAEYGHLEVVPSTGQLKIFVKALATAARDNIQGITTSAAPQALFNINNVVPAKPEDKEFTDKLQKALEKIQAGVGFSSIETPEKIYLRTKDAEGNDVLRVIDKATGEARDYKIVGPVKQVGNEVVVPTDKGDFKFAFDTKAGQPVVNVSGPDGIREVLAMLLAARGPGGIMVFDPKTGNWYAYNAQDLPLNPNFAKNGISWFGGPEGAKGLPTGNMFAIPRARREAAISPLGPFAFPSFAEGLLGAAMVALILAGVLAVRVKATAAARERRRGKRRKC